MSPKLIVQIQPSSSSFDVASDCSLFWERDPIASTSNTVAAGRCRLGMQGRHLQRQRSGTLAPSTGSRSSYGQSGLRHSSHRRTLPLALSSKAWTGTGPRRRSQRAGRAAVQSWRWFDRSFLRRPAGGLARRHGARRAGELRAHGMGVRLSGADIASADSGCLPDVVSEERSRVRGQEEGALFYAPCRVYRRSMVAKRSGL